MPNPRVGCVLVKDEKVIGEGYHQRAGQAHAEINALNSVANLNDIKGATAYVTLEPCSHYGRTGPCSDALINAGVKRVVYAMADPNPKVAHHEQGSGIERMRRAGLVVEGPLMEAQAEALNRGFLHRMRTGRPRVVCKLAMSLDGRTAMASGESQWITGPDARKEVQTLRAQSCAIVTGWSTVKVDGARMTVRSNELPSNVAMSVGDRQPLRVVLDSQTQLQGDEPLFQAEGPVLWVSGLLEPVSQVATSRSTLPTLRSTVEHMSVPLHDGHINLIRMLEELGRRECNNVLVEAGSTLAGAFVQAGLVDELRVYMAPTLMGSTAQPLLTLPIASMSDQRPLNIESITAIGKDWRIIAMPS
ncbi:riboflavin biosynthesis protein RibD [Marinibactrum halimedae]|uniref:Riboflavin biosynthesis protein RibD n=2 Tax=Marinibactrum halimedae TaxID=1444977 RepID=A0AA37TDL3_9GAMM|nr:riboflavin biosynthesis protein RibD [Marinibactrum halimedae]